MQVDIFREPFEGDNGLYTYVWNEDHLVQMHWHYSIEWPEKGGPRIWIRSYTCWQRETIEAEFVNVESRATEIPAWGRLLYLLALDAGEKLHARGTVVGSLKSVPDNFLARAAEAGKKGYDVRKLTALSQKEAAASDST